MTAEAITSSAERARTAFAATIVPTLALTGYVVGAGTVDGWRLTQFTLALLLPGGVAFGWRFGTDGWNAFGYAFLGTVLALPAGFLLTGLLVSVQHGFDFAHLGASLVVLLLVGTLLPLMMLPYPVVAGLTSAVRARV